MLHVTQNTEKQQSKDLGNELAAQQAADIGRQKLDSGQRPATEAFALAAQHLIKACKFQAHLVATTPYLTTPLGTPSH